MDKRQELRLRQALQDGGLSKRQELTVRRALAGEISADRAFDDLSLQSLIPQQSFEEMILERRGTSPEEEETFDRTTGIQNALLRTALGAAENQSEEGLILAKFGIGESDFTRDRRGNLALTPSGAKKMGVETDKNIMIDEKGFSRYDLADLVSISPEFGGAVAGAIVGQTAIPIPIVGAMIGAGLGAAGGSLLEEGVEGAFGVSDQTAGEIAKQAAIEGAFAAAGEGVIGLIGKGMGVVGRVGPSKNLPEDTLRVAGMGYDEFGIRAAPGLTGFNPLVSRAYATGEKIAGGSPRTYRNNQAINKTLQEFRDQGGDLDPNGLGQALFQAYETGSSSLAGQVKRAQEDVLRQFRSVADDFGRAAENQKDAIDADLFGAFRTAYKNFEGISAAKFKAIDDAVRSAVGDFKILPVNDIKTFAKTNFDKFDGSVMTDSTGTTVTALRSLEQLGDGNRASFAQVYNARKSLNDFISQNPKDTTLQRYGGDLLRMLDDKLEYTSIDEALKSTTLTVGPEASETLLKASEALKPARAFFREGMKEFEEVKNVANLNAIRRELRGLEDANPAGMMERLVKKDNPELLRRAKTVLKDDELYEQLRQRVAGEWIRRNIGKAVNAADSTKKFAPAAFRQKLDDLGRTGDELFGSENFKELKLLARQMEATSLKNVDESVIRAVDEVMSGSDPNMIKLLRNLKSAQDERYIFEKDRVIRQLANKTLTEDEAANLITSASTTPQTIRRIVKYFGADKPQSLQKLRSVHMESVIGDFGETFMTDPTKLKSFGTKLQKEYSSGRLTELYGEDMAKRMSKFGQVLVFNSKTVDGGGIVAAHVAMSPFANLGKLLKFGVLTRALSTDTFYKNFDKQYQALVKGVGPEERARTLGTMIGDALTRVAAQTGAQTIDESLSEGKKTVAAMAANQIEDSKNRSLETTPVPEVADFNFSTTPSQDFAPRALSPMEQLRTNVRKELSLRQRARENPAVASTLLGGLGSADLL